MALGWVRSEGVALDEAGDPVDLTIRSFGILRAADMPAVTVDLEPDDGEPVNGSDAVFAAVAAAAWRHAGHAPRWPVGAALDAAAEAPGGASVPNRVSASGERGLASGS